MSRYGRVNLVDVDPESNTTTKFITPVCQSWKNEKKKKTPASVRTAGLYIFNRIPSRNTISERFIHVRMCLYWCIRFIVGQEQANWSMRVKIRYCQLM